MAEPNNKNGLNLVNQFRSWLADFRSEANALVDLYQKRLDEIEVRMTKEGTAQPHIRVEDDEIFELELKGGPEKRV